MTEKYKVELEDFHANVVTSFKNLKSETYFHDVTLFSGDLEPVTAHKVLSSSSDYFSNILKKTNVQNPYLCLEDITRSELENVLDFVYLGEVQLQQEQLDRFLCLAQRLKLKGISYDEKEKETYKDMSQNKNQKSFKTKIKSFANDEPPKQTSFTILETDEMAAAKAFSENDSKAIDAEIDKYITKNHNNPHYSCTFCGKTSNRQRVREHVESHLEGLNISCQFCDKIFRTRNSVKVHKYTVHRNLMLK